jgi:inorganic pyrophosphatase
VKINGWFGCEEAKKEIMEGVQRYADAAEKPNF